MTKRKRYSSEFKSKVAIAAMALGSNYSSVPKVRII